MGQETKIDESFEEWIIKCSRFGVIVLQESTSTVTVGPTMCDCDLKSRKWGGRRASFNPSECSCTFESVAHLALERVLEPRQKWKLRNGVCDWNLIDVNTFFGIKSVEIMKSRARA